MSSLNKYILIGDVSNFFDKKFYIRNTFNNNDSLFAYIEDRYFDSKKRIVVNAKRVELYDYIKNYNYDDLNSFLTDINYKPSLAWKETGYQLKGKEIVVWTNDEFLIDAVNLTYVSRHPRLGNPINSRNGSYNLPDGTAAQQQNLILSNRNQDNIITDIATLLVSIDTTDLSYQLKLNKLIQNYVL